MNESALAALAVVIFGWAILSDWFAARNLTGPLVFMVAGLLLVNSDWGSGASTSRATPSMRWRSSRWRCCCSATPPEFHQQRHVKTYP